MAVMTPFEGRGPRDKEPLPEPVMGTLGSECKQKQNFRLWAKSSSFRCLHRLEAQMTGFRYLEHPGRLPIAVREVVLAEEGLAACQDAEMPFLKGIEVGALRQRSGLGCSEVLGCY